MRPFLLLSLLAAAVATATAPPLELGPERWASDPRLLPAEAQAVRATSNGIGALVAWQPVGRESIYVTKVGPAGGISFPGGAPVVVDDGPNHLGDVASNRRDYLVVFTTTAGIETAFVSDEGRAGERHVIAGPGGEDARAGSNGSGYLVTWRAGDRLMGIRVNDFGAPIGEAFALPAERPAGPAAVASNGFDYLVLVSLSGRLVAIPVSGTGDVAAAQQVAQAPVNASPLLWYDGRGYVALWQEQDAKVYTQPLEVSGKPRGNRRELAAGGPPIDASPRLILFGSGTGPLRALRIGFDGIPQGAAFDVPLESRDALAAVGGAFVAVASPALMGMYVDFFGTPIRLATTTGHQVAPQIALADGIPIAVWMEKNEVRASRIVDGQYLDGFGAVIARDVYRYALAGDGHRVMIAYQRLDLQTIGTRTFAPNGAIGDEVTAPAGTLNDVVWTGTQFTVISTHVAGSNARAETTHNGYVVVTSASGRLTATPFASDGTPRGSEVSIGDGLLFDLDGDGADRILILTRDPDVKQLAMRVIDGDGRLVRDVEPLPGIDRARVGWTGLTFLVTSGASGARFTADGEPISPFAPLFASDGPQPVSTVAAPGILLYARSLAAYHLGDNDHLMFRPLYEPTPRRRVR